MLVEMMGLGVPFVTFPVTVVADQPDLLACFIAHGTVHRQLVVADGTPIPRVVRPEIFRQLKTRTVVKPYPGNNALVVTRPGRAHAIHTIWSGKEWVFEHWYVNLQTPIERTPTGVRSADRFLDIVVMPDLSWRWKDEDELAEAVAVGQLTQAEADDVRREGERIVSDVEMRRWPFNVGYEHWRPDPAWPIPKLTES